MQQETKTEKKMSLSLSLKKLLYNLDLKISEAKAQIEVAEAELRICSNHKTKQFAKAKFARECYLAYLRQLEQIKVDTEKDLLDIVSKYEKPYQEIWKLWFLENKTIKQIALEMHYSYSQVKRIVIKQKDDLEGFFGNE